MILWNVKVILRTFRTVDHVRHEHFRPSNAPDRFHECPINVFDRFLAKHCLKTLRNSHEVLDPCELSSQHAVALWNSGKRSRLKVERIKTSSFESINSYLNSVQFRGKFLTFRNKIFFKWQTCDFNRNLVLRWYFLKHLAFIQIINVFFSEKQISRN